MNWARFFWSAFYSQNKELYDYIVFIFLVTFPTLLEHMANTFDFDRTIKHLFMGIGAAKKWLARLLTRKIF